MAPVGKITLGNIPEVKKDIFPPDILHQGNYVIALVP